MVKQFNDLQEQWNKVSEGSNWRGYLAQGYELDPDFKKSGLSWTNHLQDYLSKFSIELNNKVMLELGCGAGRMTEFLAPQVKKLYAVDISIGMLTLAHERLKEITNIEYMCLLEENGGFSIIESSSFDLVFSVAVLQHCSEHMVIDYFASVSRVLKPEGYFVFQIPIREKHETIPYEPEPAVDMTYWKLDEIKSLAYNFNYKIINIPKDTRSNGKEYFILQKI